MLALLPADPPPDPQERLRALDRLHDLDRLHAGVLEDALRLRAIQVRLGRRLLALRRAPSLYRFGATTFSLYCETVGLSASEGRDLASLAEAALVRPEVETRFAEGRLNLGKVSALAHLLRLPDAEPPDSSETDPDPAKDWVRTAENVTTRDLWRLLEEHRERQRLREAPEFVAMFVSRRGREDFLRCRDLVSRREWSLVSEGATLERVCVTYLARNDPERRAARMAVRDDTRPRTAVSSGTGPRADIHASADIPALKEDELVNNGFLADGHPDEQRAEHRAEHRDGFRRRRIPAAMQRALIRLFGDRCWVEGCDRRSFLDFAHRVPVRLGGGQEPDNLLRLCKEHHGQFDGEGWRPIPRRDGVVVLVDRRGVVVGRFRRPSDSSAGSSAGEDVGPAGEAVR